MEPRSAMARLDGIYDVLARATSFRGYRAATVLPGAALALVAGSAQAAWIPRPEAAHGAWLALWVGTAVLAALPPFGELAWRYVRSRSRLEREVTLRAVGAMLPAFGAGAVLALLAATGRSELLPLLPGLWALCFGLGLFAALRNLPGAVFGVACHYFACGALLLSAPASVALAPAAMAGTFFFGQLASALVLHRSRHAEA